MTLIISPLRSTFAFLLDFGIVVAFTVDGVFFLRAPLVLLLSFGYALFFLINYNLVLVRYVLLMMLTRRNSINELLVLVKIEDFLGKLRTKAFLAEIDD